MGSFQRKNSVKFKLITSALPSRLKKFRDQIKRFCRKFNLDCLGASLATKFDGKPAPIWKLLCLDRNGV